MKCLAATPRSRTRHRRLVRLGWGAGIAGAALLLYACAAPTRSARQTSGEWTVRGYLPRQQFVVQSHRGAGFLAPENTLEAFELGWKLGAWPEADVRTTKDGVIVAFHDGNFKRTVKNPPPELARKGVKDVTFAELSTLDVGGWKGDAFVGRRVSRLAEIFRLMTGRPERMLYLDIKQVDLAQLAAEVRAERVVSQVVFTSPNYPLIREWKRLVPESKTLCWLRGPETNMTHRLAEMRALNYADLTQVQLHLRANTNRASSEPFDISRAFVRATGEELRRYEVTFQVLPWDLAAPEIYWQLMDLGVMAFATDYPDIALQAVRDYYAGRNRGPADTRP